MIYIVRICGEETKVLVDSLGKTLNIGEVYSFSDGITTFCGEVIEETDGSSNYNPLVSYGPRGCDTCISETPTKLPSYTSNTIQEMCIQVCDPISGGTTVVSVNPPHPVWTGVYGQEITQGNAITLGGPNGLNS